MPIFVNKYIEEVLKRNTLNCQQFSTGWVEVCRGVFAFPYYPTIEFFNNNVCTYDLGTFITIKKKEGMTKRNKK